MKKRILALASVLALVAVLAMPMAALAETTVVTANIAATPVVTSLSPNNGNPGQAATLTTITGSSFENTGDTVVTMSGPGLTITASTYVNATTITFQLAIAAGATATAGARDVTVTQGGASGTGTGKFTVNTVTTIGAPAGFNLGYMTVAGSPKTGSSADGSITTNGGTYQVTAKDSTTVDPYKGFMSKAGPAYLATKMQISKTAVDSGLVTADTGLTYNSPATVLKFYVSQAIGGGDAAGTYTITITYTVTVQ